MAQIQIEPWLNEGNCWICGAFADSAEHFVKASDLRFNWGRGAFAMTPIDQAPIKIQGPNSTKLKYRPSLCQTCNNERTQSSDLAWEEFNERIQPVAARKANSGAAHLPKLFSNARWRKVMLGVHLYWAKALGCYLAECNQRHLAKDIRQAILDQKPCLTLQLVFFATPAREERLLHRSSLKLRASKHAAFFMYAINCICVTPILSQKPDPYYPRFQHWHPNGPAKSIRLHKLGRSEKEWEPPRETAAASNEILGSASNWWDSNDG